MLIWLAPLAFPFTIGPCALPIAPRELPIFEGPFDRFMVELVEWFMFPGCPVVPIVVGLPVFPPFVLPPIVVVLGLPPIPVEGLVFVGGV